MSTDVVDRRSPDSDRLVRLRRINASAAFNRWCGIEVTEAADGRAVIEMPWRDEAGQYAGFLHAGLIGALIDTACGFAAATMTGDGLLAAQFAVDCLRPAVGERFVAAASVVKPGRMQFFTTCELSAWHGGKPTLVATGATLLTVTSR